MEYIIVADYILSDGKVHECLVTLCGRSKEAAEEILNRMQTNPTETDRKLIHDGTNLRIKEVESEKQWWNDPFLCN